MRIDNAAYVAFDTNIWRSKKSEIQVYRSLPLEKRPKIICGPQTIAEAGSAKPSIALAALERCREVSEEFARPSDDILRSALSIVEFGWTNIPRIVCDKRESDQIAKWLSSAIESLRSGETEFYDSQNRNREKRKVLISGNQDKFKELWLKKEVRLSEKAQNEAFRTLENFDLKDYSIQKICLTSLPIIFAAYPLAVLTTT